MRIGAVVALLLLTASSCARYVFVELREPVPIEELPRLERELGVRILQFQHDHPGGMTAGGLVREGQALDEAVAEHLLVQRDWCELRPGAMRELAAAHRDEPSRRALREVEAACADFAANGARIARIAVDAWPWTILRVRQHPGVAP